MAYRSFVFKSPEVIKSSFFRSLISNGWGVVEWSLPEPVIRHREVKDGGFTQNVTHQSPVYLPCHLREDIVVLFGHFTTERL